MSVRCRHLCCVYASVLFLDSSIGAALHASRCPHSFVECSDPPFDALVHLEGKGVAVILAKCLDSGIKFLVFSGVNDLICNHIGKTPTGRSPILLQKSLII